MDDTRAAWAFVGIIIAVKVVVAGLLLIYLPIGEALTLYTVVHLAAFLGIPLLLLLTAGTLLFWWRILRLRARRQAFRWAEWHVKGQPV